MVDKETKANKILKDIQDLLGPCPILLEEIMKMSKNHVVSNKDEILQSINKIFDDLHKNLDEESENFIAEIVKNLPQETEAKIISEAGETPNENDNRPMKDKIKELMDNLDVMINSASVVEEVSNYIKDCPLEKLLKINKKENRLKFKKIRLQGVSLYDVGTNEINFDSTLATRRGRAEVNNDGKQLDINSSSCWNFFATKESFTDGLINFNIEVEISEGDNHFYVGIVNELKDLLSDNGCLCCTNPNSWYFDRAGSISCNNKNGVSTINISNPKKFTAQIIADLNEKTVIFIDGNSTSSSFPITGKSFRFLVACCNTLKAKVTIID